MSRQLLSITLPQGLAPTFSKKSRPCWTVRRVIFTPGLWADSACKLGFTCPDGVGGCSMSRQHQFITLTEGLARTLIQEIQAVLDSESELFSRRAVDGFGAASRASPVRA